MFIILAHEKRETIMTSYIIRIYREEENNPRNFVGTVEEAGGGERRAFTSLDELWSILNPAVKEKMGIIDEAEHTLRSAARSKRRR